MKQIMTYLRDDKCPHCGAERSIECYDRYDRGINYTILLDRLSSVDIESKIINTKELSHMKCKRCNTVFCIDWTGNYPKPLKLFFKVENFLYQNYKM